MNECDWSDYEHDRQPAVAPRRQPGPQFVQASPAPITRRVEILPPAQPHELQHAQPVQTVQRLDTSHVDRARGFTIASVPLAAALGLVAFLVAVALFGVPWLSGAALVVLFGVFGLVWLTAWLWYNAASPDGVALAQVMLGYRLLRHEQRARLERMKGVRDDDRNA